MFHIDVLKLLCFGFKNQKLMQFLKVFFQIRFSDLGFNHNKNNACFRVRVEWRIEGLKSKWKRLMKIFDST
jgi:hypothetical protein